MILSHCHLLESLAKANLSKSRKLPVLICETKQKLVTIQMKALDKYIPMVLFVSLLKRLNFLFVCFLFLHSSKYA